MAFLPDGKVLATGSTEAGADQVTVSFWDVATAKRITRFNVPSRAAFALTFAPDCRALATARAGGTIHLWDLATGAELLSRAGYSARVTFLAFRPIRAGSPADTPITPFCCGT
jgi:WD40 repeat protein